VLSQVLNGVLLPFVLVFMLILVNRKSLMKSQRNGPAYNTVAWGFTVVATVLTAMMLIGILKGS